VFRYASCFSSKAVPLLFSVATYGAPNNPSSHLQSSEFRSWPGLNLTSSKDRGSGAAALGDRVQEAAAWTARLII
jgi:hypothetical protein